ncbi:thioredoxin family protein [Microbacterium sp. zg.Y1090]|uniref:thioredoxin family protein n=1 Tax=Microbacterium TaxID=33882 RepID=UPI00214BE773|nr:MULTISPECIES: thioredoxin family protein [unclassified Microbacterium]MCR2813395.1 thioredoxin family protein [Microbacterium sp. zg.Y1084]MCR2818269.1 thioredoxin family protein [Microbacterium sp. zg.Y1090]MDL5486790.1 thioredoxin family protein [Microbacterium sp. zg-Y1211]WIM27586.1 thioredoxin family protein [Microbacterium sp. zg-Y1090]
MNPVDALIILTALLAVTIGAGAIVRWRQGRPVRHAPDEIVDPERLGAPGLGHTATLLQFSTELCARCPGVHRTLSALAAEREGVMHLDVDLTHRPDIAKHFHVLQTPTTLILDQDGAIQTRVGGIPSRHVIELELSRLGSEAHGG